MGLFDKLLPPGKMELTLDKFNYATGETIKGTASLTTNKPIHAKGVFVKLFALEKVSSTTGGSHSSSTRTVFDFQQPLDNERDYNGGVYDFKITIPKQPQQGDQKAVQMAQTAAAAINALQGKFQSRNLKWFVEAKLDIPGGRDISKKVQINVA
ncbi:MAG: hypothetical protein KAW41_02435 [Candidatus Diapherotrites archaeon]|nr:hypothetical protein [Candidatus Diapherotrites archaeon]